MGFQCFDKESEVLLARIESGDIEAFEEIIQSFDETNSHIEYGMVEALEALKADLGLIRIVEREDIVLTEELARSAQMQKEPTGLETEYLSDEELHSLIKDYLPTSNGNTICEKVKYND